MGTMVVDVVLRLCISIYIVYFLNRTRLISIETAKANGVTLVGSAGEGA
jgi:hypothetical protein